MKEFVKKLIEKLEEESHWEESTFDEDGYCNDDSEEVIYLHKAIEIVNQLAEEYNGKYLSKDEVGYMLDTIEMRGDETWMDYYHKALKGLCELSGGEYNNGWIPCSERLPKDDEYVLCSLNENNPMIIHTIIIAQYNGENHWYNGTVVAWQPLPPAYVQKEGRE